MSDDDERSSGGKKIWRGIREAFLCMSCRNLLCPPVMLVERVGNVCYGCYEEMKGDNCSCFGRSPSIIFPIAGSSSGHEIVSELATPEVIFEPPAMNLPPQHARVHRNMEQDIEHGSCPSDCNCYICKMERAELSPITERGTTSEEDRSEGTSLLVECVAEVHRANDQDETLETVTSEEGTTTSEPCKFEEVVDITNSVEAETAESAVAVYSDDRHECPVTDKRLVPQDSSSSNETSEPTETTTAETPEDYSQDQRSQQIEVSTVESNTERSNLEAEDVTDAVRIVNDPECFMPLKGDPTPKKAEDSEELVCEDNISKEMPTESSGIDIPEGPVRPSASKSDESEDSVPIRRMVRDKTSLDVDPKPEAEKQESQTLNIHEGKMTTIEKFGAEERKLESSDDESEEEDEKSHDHRGSEEPESSKPGGETSASGQRKSQSKKYDGEKSTTRKGKNESLAEEGSSEEKESTDNEGLEDEPDIPSSQKGGKFESKEGDGESSADDLLGEEESEEESCDDKKSSKTKEDDVATHRKEKSIDREGVESTKERNSSMKSPEVKDSSEGEESDDEDECKDQEASTSQTEKYAEEEEPKDSKREYRPLEEEDTSEGEQSGDVADSRKKGEKKEESKRDPKNVESTGKEQECTKEKTTRYDRLTESETEDEESNGDIKKEVRDEKEAEQITAKEEGGPSQDKSSGEKASKRGTPKANGKSEDMSITSAQKEGRMAEKEKSTPTTGDKNSENAKCSKQEAGEKDQQGSSSTRDKEQKSSKKSPGASKNLAEKEGSSDVTEARDTVLMIIERNSPPKNPAKMIPVRTLYGIENVALAQIMKELRFQCKNHIHGCKESFSPEEMVAHEETCLFQRTHCEFEDCIWIGTLNKYTRHFLRHTDLKKLQTVDDRFNLSKWNSQDSTCILQTSGGSFILSMRVLEGKLYYLIYDLRRTPGKAKFDLFFEYYGKSGAKFKIRCNITRSAKLKCFDERKATAIDLNMLNSFIPLEDNPRMSIYVESDDPCFRMRTTFINLLKCRKCGLYMDSPIKQCMYGHYVCGSCNQNVKECPECDASLVIVEALNKWKDDAKYVCKFDLGKKVDLNLTSYHESSLCTFHPWTCPKCPAYKFKPFYDYFELIEHMVGFHRVPVLPNSESIKKLSQLSYEIYFIQFSKLFLFKSVYLRETDTSEFYVIYIGPKQDRYRYEIQIKYKKGFYTKYMSLSCECAYNKSNEILRMKSPEAEQTTPVNAMSPAEVYISPDSSDLLPKEAEEGTKGSTEQSPQNDVNEVAQSQTSATRRRSSLPQISTVKARYLTSQSNSNRETQTPTSTRLSYSKSPSPAKVVKQNTNQKIAMRNSQDIQRRSIGSTVQESQKPKPANTPGIRKSSPMTSAAIPKKISSELSASIRSKSLAVKGKCETDEEKLKPDEGIVIQNGLERFGERFKFDVKITKISERNFS